MAQINNEDRVCLAVVDSQVLHYGHLRLLLQMRATAKRCLVGIGSVKKSGQEGHPFTFEERMSMIEAIFGGPPENTAGFRFIPLDDIDASVDNDDWCAYVLGKIRGLGLPAPTDYFSGSRIDAKWYEPAFARLGDGNSSRVFDSALATVYEDVDSGKRIHIVDRDKSGLPLGREIRALIERRDDEWRRYVPERLHSFIEWNYPPHLRQALRGTAPPESKLPVGTRFKADGLGRDGEVLELKDDGKWRPLSNRDEKRDYARSRRGDRC
ncbi:hypothetical protein [Bosea sp. ANAM02]|uniref:hypothetical protein n=1 Tax=Bosea sp. ANAM02 TaxID=2020412 RepID=UPI00140F42F1|nr:hypothetical protein [Bosea sp. ANAM02]BCB22492.1 hypothetical protein OCUBac02_53860 [Bosea sp. ANAM02]